MNSRRQRGTVSTWNEGKGFGFIASENETEDVFLHISALPRESPRPTVGDVVTYVTGSDEKGRLRAVQARLEGAGASPRAGRVIAICIAAAFLAALAVEAFRGRIVSDIPVVYAVMSAVTFAAYRHDKSRAQTGDWRASEKTLHLLEFFGGWPGALIAQQWLRHKNRKLSYQIVFWLIVLAHFAAWTFFMPRG